MKLRPHLFIITGLVFMAAGFLFSTSLTGPEHSDTESGSSGLIPEPPVFKDISGRYRPGFSLPDLDGQIRSASEWDGKVILVNFWATWCLPCLKEIPELLDLRRKYQDQGFEVIGIALQKAEELPGFIAQHNMTYPILAGEAEVIVVAEQYGNSLGALPYTAIVGRNGIVAFTKAGPVTSDEVEGLIVDLLL